MSDLFNSNQRLDEFEAAWRAGARPNFLDFFSPEPAPNSADHNLEVMLIDLEHRIRVGDEGMIVNQYAPHLEDNGDSLLHLIEQEFILRWRRGDRVFPAAYSRAFPELASRLQDLKPTFDCPNCGQEEISFEPDKQQLQCPLCEARVSLDAIYPIAKLAVGDRGQIRLEHEIGQGSFGTVYRGWDKEFDRPVAVKVLREEHLQNEAVKASFWKECKVLAGLQHSGVPSIYARGMLADRRPFFAMRVIEGESFQSLLDRDSASPEGISSLLSYWLGVCRIVSYAHQRDTIHGDISPRNILVSNNGEVFLTDWSPIEKQSAPASPLPEKDWADSGDRNRSSGSAATLPYAAPELFSGQALTPASDVFALGSILSQIVSGTPLYSIEDLRDGELNLEPGLQRLRQFAWDDSSNLDQELAEVIAGMIDRKAGSRISATEAVARVSRWVNAQTIRSVEFRVQAAEAEKRVAEIEQRITVERELRQKAEMVHLANARAKRHSLLALTTTVALLAVSIFFAIFGWQTAQRNKASEQQELALKEQAEAAWSREKQKTRQLAEIAKLLGDVLIAPDPLSLDFIGLRKPNEVGYELDNLQVLHRVQERVESLIEEGSETEAILLEAVGFPLRSSGAFEKSLPILERALALRRQQPQPDEQAIAVLLYQLAMLHHDARHFTPAENYYEESIQLCEKRKDFSLVAQIKVRYAWMLGEMQRTAQALKILDDVLEYQTLNQGINSKEVEIARFAKLFVSLSGTKKSEALQEAMQLAEEGSEIFKVAARYGIALLHRQSGNFKQAEKVYESVLQDAKKYLPPRHPIIGLLVGDIAGMYRKIGDIKSAEKYILEAIQIGRITFPTHEFMLEALTEYGSELERQNRLDEAEKILKEALVNAEKRAKYTDDNWRQRVIPRLIAVYRKQGKDAEIQELESQRPAAQPSSLQK